MRLIDADELKKNLQNWIRENWPYTFIGDDAGVEFIDIIDSVPTASQWISVEDRLPEYQEKVLCFYENGFMGTAVFYGISADPHKSSNDFASYSHDYMTENSKIKFWMPLPEPPKENEDETD